MKLAAGQQSISIINMRRPAMALGAAAAALLLALAAAPAPAAAQLFQPSGPLEVGVSNDTEAAVFRAVLGAVLHVSESVVEGRNVTDGLVMAASSAPAGASPELVSKMIGRVLASAALDYQASKTLGPPSVFPYANRHALYRFPGGRPTRNVRGICVFIHGCKHDAESWFYKSDECPKCTGLPEEVSHSKQCLARGYVVLALSSKNREYRDRCFRSSGGPDTDDQPEAKMALERFVKKFRLMTKPIYMFGISSGASFAIKFPMTKRIQGVVSEVNMPWEDAWHATDGNGNLEVRYPPVVYYAMERDTTTRQQIREAMAILRKNRVPSAVVEVPVRAIDRSFLYERSIFISKAQSATIQKALFKVGVLNANGWLKYDPRMNRIWTQRLPKVLPWLKRSSPYYNIVSDESQIWQAMNMAYSMHEIVSDYVRATLIWLEKRGHADLDALVRQYGTGNMIRCLTEHREGC